MPHSEDTNKYIQLFEHTLSCPDPLCDQNKCRFIKSSMDHHRNCPHRTKCKTCLRVYLLAYLHAKGCKKDDCPVVYCDDVRIALYANELKVGFRVPYHTLTFVEAFLTNQQ